MYPTSDRWPGRATRRDLGQALPGTQSTDKRQLRRDRPTRARHRRHRPELRCEAEGNGEEVTLAAFLDVDDGAGAHPTVVSWRTANGGRSRTGVALRYPVHVDDPGDAEKQASTQTVIHTLETPGTGTVARVRSAIALHLSADAEPTALGPYWRCWKILWPRLASATDRRDLMRRMGNEFWITVLPSGASQGSRVFAATNSVEQVFHALRRRPPGLTSNATPSSSLRLLHHGVSAGPGRGEQGGDLGAHALRRRSPDDASRLNPSLVCGSFRPRICDATTVRRICAVPPPMVNIRASRAMRSSGRLRE